MTTRMGNMDGRLSEIGYEVKMQTRDTNHLQTSVYWGFAIMAVVIALVGFVITLAPMFREMYRDARQAKRESALTRSEVEEMIAEAISRTLKS